jgi:hypothetical protein
MGENVGEAPPDAPTLTALRSWGLGVCAGPTVGSAAVAHGLAPDVAWHAPERRVPETFPSSPVSEHFSLKISTEVAQGFYTKVVDHTTLYNFAKGSRVFFSTICAQIACQVGYFLGACE